MMLELISPASSQNSVIAAVQSGADSIYLQVNEKKIDPYEPGFTTEELEYALRYAHVRGCRVYIDMDTFCSDTELTEGVKMAGLASDLGADAVILSDLGLAHALSSALPDLPLFGGARLGIHNLAGVEAAHEMGMSRAWLARELSLEQLSYIAARTPIPLAVAVHGKLCASYCGQCFLGAMTRNGISNKGGCLSPCRQRFNLGRMEDYPLSLKDNCLLRHLEELELAGVSAAVIEGINRSPEYSAFVTGVYSAAIRDKKTPSPLELKSLGAAFSPQGFTDGFFKGSLGPQMLVGEETLPKPGSRFFSGIRKGFTSSELRRVPVTFYAVIRKGEMSRFAAEDADGHRVTVDGPSPEKAVTQALTTRILEEVFYKTGGTPYICSGVESLLDLGLYLSEDYLGQVRRQLLSQLSEKRALAPRREKRTLPPAPFSRPGEGPPVLNVQISAADQLSEALLELGIANIYVPIEVLVEEHGKFADFAAAGVNLAVILPRVITGAENADMRGLLQRARALGVSQALVGNMGHIRLARLEGFQIRGDFGLNIQNAYSLKVLSEANFLSATASFELKMSEIAALPKPLATEAIVYGRLPLMLTPYCIIKNSTGKCTCGNPNQLSDKQGSLYPVMREFGCRNTVYHSRKLFLAGKMDELRASNLWGLRLLFTTESARECARVAKSFLGLSEYRPNGLTLGLYY